MSIGMRKNSEERIWITSFDDDALKRFYTLFLDMEHDPFVQTIPIVVSSYGGSLDNLEAMRDLIKSSEKTVSITAIGKAMSAGMGLLAAGTKGMRFIAPGTNIMLHELSAGAFGKMEEIRSQTKMFERSNERFIKNMANDMGKSATWLKKEINKRNNSDWFMDAEEAVKVGIADIVGVPRSYMEQPRQVLFLKSDSPQEEMESEVAAPKRRTKNKKPVDKKPKKK